MRADMYKVIVERPRSGKGWRVDAHRRRFDWDGPSRAAMRAGIGRPHLNENLKPLKRYLLAQVGRPWDKVKSEIAANIDRRNTVQEHIYSHIDNYIAVQVEWRHGALIDLRRPYTPRHGDELRQPLYVDPRTGVIRPNKNYGADRREYRKRLASEAAEIAARRRPLGDGRWHLKMDGEWYEVQLMPMPPSEVVELDASGRLRRWRKASKVFDVILKQRVSRELMRGSNYREALYGSPNLYAVSRRQLSKREIAKYRLR